MFTEGTLFDGNQAYSWLRAALRDESQDVSICSAYLKAPVVVSLLESSSNARIRFLARWALGDLLSGASDLDAYKVIRDKGMQLYISNTFHGKVYALPSSSILVGSANATRSGFGLVDHSNVEVCTLVSPIVHNLTLVDSLFASSRLVTDELFKVLSDYVSNVPIDTRSGSLMWPDEIADALTPQLELTGFLLSDFLVTDGVEIVHDRIANTEDAKTDLSLLCCQTSVIEIEVLASQFRRLKIFQWLKKILAERDGEMYFGELTVALHDAMMEDPAPYRRTVKNILANLLKWIELLGPAQTNISIDRPNHSQRIRLMMVNLR